MGTHFWIKGQRAESNANEHDIIDADDVIKSGHFAPDRDIIQTTPDGQTRLINPGSKLPALSGTRFMDVPKGTRG